jgi:hypothetical protein
MEGAGRLKALLGRQAGYVGLDEEEEQEAHELIAGTVLGDEICWLCRMTGASNAAIKGLGLCRGHAFYALATGR